jgi:hypothetical protein
LARLSNACVARAARRVDSLDEISFVCECDDVRCSERLLLQLQPYDTMRDGGLCIVSPGHDIGTARIASRGPDFDTYRRAY